MVRDAKQHASQTLQKMGGAATALAAAISEYIINRIHLDMNNTLSFGRKKLKDTEQNVDQSILLIIFENKATFYNEKMGYFDVHFFRSTYKKQKIDIIDNIPI